MWMNALPTILTTALNFAITRRDLIIASVQKDMLSITSTIPPAMVCFKLVYYITIIKNYY